MQYSSGCMLGCTAERPHAACLEGCHLFAAFIRAKHALSSSAAGENQQERWQAYSRAQQAYLSHIAGWQEGDLRIRQEATTWLIEVYQQGVWSSHDIATQEGPLQAWLLEQGYRRYAPLESGPEESLAGYYRHLARGNTTRILSLQETPHSPVLPQSSTRQAAGSLDVKTRVAILLALLVERLAHPPTLVDRLYLQRQAVNILLSHGIERIEREHLRMIDALVDEVERVRDMLERQQTPHL